MRLLAAIAVVVAAGCAKDPAPAARPLPPMAPMQATPPPPQPQPSAAAITGTVLETAAAPGYTYLRLRTATGEQWAAIPTAAIAVGATVALVNPMPMQNFVSKTLNRTFPEIFFCSGVETVGAAAPVAAVGAVGAAPRPDPAHDALLAWAGQGNAPIAKASGADAKTVAEIHQQRAALANTSVRVRGKVVKATRGVLGKNWLHLQDGSGDAAKKDHDLVVTTSGEAAVGDVVSAHGAVHLDRDFGAGYVFAVIIEDATLTR